MVFPHFPVSLLLLSATLKQLKALTVMSLVDTLQGTLDLMSDDVLEKDLIDLRQSINAATRDGAAYHV